MRVSKAKRRLLKWQRYVQQTGTKSNRDAYSYYHIGHIIAYANVLYAKRYAPKGVRQPWYLNGMP